ncbi:HIT domain-containing protein [Mucilaginibacter sp. dw_454]|uniref:HIT family protein n=1 Tax=Mucilaginibacter sp. dw_454 TaxID=2720079 RepID=UPI001BD2D41A|nr:HIT domain-containing protein [Mucilaginibacter sp. dw_454]
MYNDPLCPFCDITTEKKIFRWINAIPKDLISFNRIILYENEYFVIIPDISPIVEYHVLIIPKLHYQSISEIPIDSDIYIADAREFIKNLYLDMPDKEVIFFEHGSCNITGSACINHAHLHCLPLEKKEIRQLQLKVDKINDGSDLFVENESYLSFEISGRTYKWADNWGIKQFLRKTIAETVRRPNRNNWQGSLSVDSEKEITKKWLNNVLIKFKKSHEDQ